MDLSQILGYSSGLAEGNSTWILVVHLCYILILIWGFHCSSSLYMYPTPFDTPPPPQFFVFCYFDVVAIVVAISYLYISWTLSENNMQFRPIIQVTYIYICVIFTFNNCYHSQCQDWKEIFLCINIYYMQPKLVLVFKKNWQEYERWIVNLYFWRNSSLYC